MTESTPIALLVEDDPQIRRFVRASLEEDGWQVFEAGTLHRASIDAASRKPDLIILDLGLPDGDGVDFIVSIRQWSAMPIIVLSARITEEDKIRALDAGADDYLTKPFGVGELLARVRAARRRRYELNIAVDGNIHFGRIRIDLTMRRVTKDEVLVHLTPTEYRLLAVLVGNAGRVVTTRQLMLQVWGPGQVDNAHYLRIYMGHLRQKLEDDPAQPRYLLTETAVGYRLYLPGE
ncbi:two-component system response regulator KdpE [Herbaspirillum sp. RTI4]|uniref:two-component system response regulator KdpE n=1 Tax=Herbaspirillum sp. RTI4 TaxID=3048640 RepID=UPI002AB49227|nr:two-component system response regulator KdpE [Herbaspirillum sp. RTI4]MDY7577148.1 two-component system response regulator KdpE [Herbaspirillum sp. RTI4]MEA9980438.1 two-component system response regulator KdpE [Herbaspirillum sp. RTI4]